MTAVCPVPVNYTPAEVREAATELQALPETSELRVFMTDYDHLQREARACAG